MLNKNTAWPLIPLMTYFLEQWLPTHGPLVGDRCPREYVYWKRHKLKGLPFPLLERPFLVLLTNSCAAKREGIRPYLRVTGPEWTSKVSDDLKLKISTQPAADNTGCRQLSQTRPRPAELKAYFQHCFPLQKSRGEKLIRLFYFSVFFSHFPLILSIYKMPLPVSPRWLPSVVTF